MKKVSSTILSMALGLLLSGYAHAGTTTAVLEVITFVGVDCTVSSTPVDFGGYDPAIDLPGSGTITVQCTPGSLYNISLNGGLYADELIAGMRHLSNETDMIPYSLLDPTGSQPWGDQGFDETFPTGGVVAGTGDGFEQVYTVNAILQADGMKSGGIYTDFVEVTVHF
jgi:spore coat protein U-like protein